MMKPRGSNGTVQDFVGRLVAGKKVLDIGCVEHSAEREQKATWLPRYVVENAKSVLGVDILEEGVRQLVQKGYHVVCADATCVELPEKYDVILAGELIEHLDNPGWFLLNMGRHLSADGVIVLTTPNVFYSLHFFESLFLSPYKRWNPEHVSWYCYFTLENLLKRNGLCLHECIFFARSRKIRALLKLLRLPCPRFLASSMVAIAKPSPSRR